jgi:hypothetical protein
LKDILFFGKNVSVFFMLILKKNTLVFILAGKENYE